MDNACNRNHHGGREHPTSTATPTSNGPRVEYRRDRLTEWYVNGPRGLEQGFTLAAPPAGAEQFTVSLAITGDAPTQADRSTLQFGDLHYSDLAVTDASGATLPAHLDVADGTIRIAVDATGAQWPVTVDPTITSATLAASDPSSADRFGTSVAVAMANGTTTVVGGAPEKTVGGNTAQGAAYVFTGSSGTDTQQPRLDCACVGVNFRFGYSVAVAVSGGTTTVVVGAPGTKEVDVFTGSGGALARQAVLTTANLAGTPSYGYAVAALTTGATTTIAVRDPTGYPIDPGVCGGNCHVGAVYLYAGAGASYPLQTTLSDTTPTNVLIYYGTSLALATNGSTNTLVVGARNATIAGHPNQGKILVYTGSGSTYSVYLHSAADGEADDSYGSSVAVSGVRRREHDCGRRTL